MSSHWIRQTRKLHAQRGDGLRLVLTDRGWLVQTFHDLSLEPFIVPGVPAFRDAIDDAIEALDCQYPPENWTAPTTERPWWQLDAGDGWKVFPAETGWVVDRRVEGEWERASVKVFPTGDRARRWAEVRKDRTGNSLRGQPTRSDVAASCRLPDVRCTEAEREEAKALMAALDTTFSQFVRDALARALADLEGREE